MNPCKCGCDRDEHCEMLDEAGYPWAFCTLCDTCDGFRDEDGVR